MASTIQEPHFELDDVQPLPHAGDWSKKPKRKDVWRLLYRLPMKFKMGQQAPDASPAVDGIVRPGKGKMQHESAIDFLLGSHDIDDDDDNAKWEPSTLLGQGGFGKVGLWRKVDSGGSVVDSIAIKQQPLNQAFLEEDHGTVGLHPEAIIHLGLQQKERKMLQRQVLNNSVEADRDRHIVHMRQYKFEGPGNGSGRSFCRMYLDYCPHGTIADLTQDYRVFTKKLPTPFLWHLFHSLALAIRAMDGRCLEDAFLYKWRDQTGEPQWLGVEHWTLHMDIKDVNVLLAEPDREARDESAPEWPSVKIADFGVSTYTSASDKRNPPPGMGRGTLDGMPPEQQRWHHEFKDPPNWSGQQWTQTHMVWQIAKVVWDCAAHWRRNKIRLKMESMSEKKYKKNGNHWIASDHRYMRSLGDDDLAKLLHSCMDPTASNRPMPKDLVERTRRGLKESLRKKNGKKAKTKLYFRGREVGDMKPGKQDINRVVDDYIAVRFRNPEDPIDIPGKGWSGMKKTALEQIRDWAKEAKLNPEDYVDPWPLPRREGKAKKKKRKRKKRARTDREKLLRLTHPEQWYASDEDSDPRNLSSLMDSDDDPGMKSQRKPATEPDVNADQQNGSGKKRKSDQLEDTNAQENRGSSCGSNPQRRTSAQSSPHDDTEGAVAGRSSPDPTTQDYMRRTAKALLADMGDRGIAIPKGANRVKATYTRLLRDVDKQGTKGKKGSDVQAAQTPADAAATAVAPTPAVLRRSKRNKGGQA